MIAKAIYARLTGSVGVTAITRRVYPKFLPQPPTLPAITYGIDGDQPQVLLDGAETLREATVDIDCWSKDYLECHSLAVAVEAALADFRGDFGVTPTVTSEHIRLERKFDLYEDDTKFYRVTMQFLIAYY